MGKKIIVSSLSVIVLLFSSCTTYEKNIESKELSKNTPKLVLDSFKKRHLNAIPIFYKLKEKNNIYYEAEFKSNGKDFSESYNTQGELVETEVYLTIQEIPDNIYKIITNDLSARYGKHKILNIQQVSKKELKFYEIKIKTIKSSTGIMEVSFDHSGKWLSETVYKLHQINTLN
jgi:hypothetical protein